MADEEQLMWVNPGDGKMSKSRKKPGSMSPLTRDADGNLGQVTMRPADPDEFAPAYEPAAPVEQQEAEPSFGVQIGTVLANAIAEVGVDLVREMAIPAAKARLRERRERKAAARATPPVESAEVSQRVVLTADEARQRYIAAVAAQQFAEQQLGLLDGAVIDDGAGELGPFDPAELEGNSVAELISGMRDAFSAAVEEAALRQRVSQAQLVPGPGVAPLELLLAPEDTSATPEPR